MIAILFLALAAAAGLPAHRLTILTALVFVVPLVLIAMVKDNAVVTSVDRRTRGHCPECDYELRYNFKHGCPECGWRRHT